METIVITKKWHKANAPYAMTYKQLQYIEGLRDAENCPEWPFRTTSNAMRSLTAKDASMIINALKAGDGVVFE